MTNPKLPKPPLPSGQPNPSLNELVAIKSELKKLNQKVLEIEGAFSKHQLPTQRESLFLLPKRHNRDRTIKP